MAENIAYIFKKYGVGTYHKPYNTLRSQLVCPKDQTPDSKKCGVIYELNWENCDGKYVGETSRSLGTRIKEHKRSRGSLTAVGEHIKDTGHSLDDKGTRVVAREAQYWPRKIHEAIEIKLRTPNLNRDTGYHLPRSTTVYCQVTSVRGHLTGRRFKTVRWRRPGDQVESSESSTTDSKRYLHLRFSILLHVTKFCHF